MHSALTSYDHRSWLLECFSLARSKNPRISLRGFSKKLGVSHSALSEVISGKRPLTRKMAERFAERLKLEPEKTQQLIRSVILSKLQSSLPDDAEINQITDQKFTPLNLDVFNVISDWYHFAILSLLETEESRLQLRWISARLGIPERETRQAVKRLIKLGFIKRRGRSFELPTKPLSICTQGYDVAMRTNMHQYLDKAHHSLDTDPAEVRELSTSTIAIDPKNIPRAREAIKRFRREVSQLLERGKKTRVYSMSVQLIPLDGDHSLNERGEINV